ncbi:hypothetical protein PMAYCL1PPCAC_20229 [Pristionchus mayeri]|uniref:F-box domain-containing protein n=1 Tax=Pristionchus mayeri TaxID=1317129 RepID=A0AAN5CTG3_9BILA|nr:hypothetical protein PMAYCL1PPCAC_20229 [Pristionchus mayeri]
MIGTLTVSINQGKQLVMTSTIKQSEGSPLPKRLKLSRGEYHCAANEDFKSVNGVFPIEQLPPEIIRMIIGCMPWETNRELRATSRMFNEIVDDLVWKPRTCPLVTTLRVSMWRLNGTSVYGFSIEVPKHDRILFELRIGQLEIIRPVERDHSHNHVDVGLDCFFSK